MTTDNTQDKLNHAVHCAIFRKPTPSGCMYCCDCKQPMMIVKSKPDNTQEHMHNSGESTSCAQRSAQAELDDILARHNGELGITWEDPDVVTPDTKQALLDWHNKQVESELKSIYSELGHIKAVRDCIDDRQAEHNKLKGSSNA